MNRGSRLARFSAVGVVVGGVLGYAGVTFAGAPLTIETCTHINSRGQAGGVHVLHNGQTCNTSNHADQHWVLQAYQQLMRDADAAPGSGKTSQSYAGFNLSDLSLPGSGISGTTTGGDNGQGDFAGANLSLSRIAGTQATSIWNDDDFSGANFTGAVLTGTTFHSDSFAGANLTNANLSGSDFTGTTMTSAIYSNTVCPNGTNSNSHSGTCAGQGGGL